MSSNFLHLPSFFTFLHPHPIPSRKIPRKTTPLRTHRTRPDPPNDTQHTQLLHFFTQLLHKKIHPFIVIIR